MTTSPEHRWPIKSEHAINEQWHDGFDEGFQAGLLTVGGVAGILITLITLILIFSLS